MAILKWLRKPVPTLSDDSTSIDIAQLDRSMHLLRTTTAEVSQAAVNAARTLEEQLQWAEFRFNSTIDHIDDLVIVKDGSGRWKTLNKIGQDAFGWHHGEYYDKTDLELAEAYPRYKATLLFCHKTDEIAWEMQKSFRVEEIIPDGTNQLIFDVVKTPVFNDDGTPKELIVIGRDVTESREKQRRMRACFHALNSASDVIAIIDKHGRIFFCNDRFTDAFGVVDYNSCVSQKLEDVVGPIHPDMWETVQKNIAWTGPFGIYNLNVFPMMNGEPKPIYHVCTFKKPY